MKIKVISLLILLSTTNYAFAAGPTGKRKVASYWLENNAFLAVNGDVAFDNPDSCTKSDKVILPMSHVSYKQFLATIMLAKASGYSFTAYASGCYSAWGRG